MNRSRHAPRTGLSAKQFLSQFSILPSKSMATTSFTNTISCKSMLLRPLFFTATLLLAHYAEGQEINKYNTPVKQSAYLNGITLNFPNYVQIAEFGGWSIGAEYRRLLNSQGTLGTSLSYTRLIWAGTAEAGKYYAHGQRANITANLLGPGFNYFPMGSRETASLEIGVIALIGSVRRIDSYQSPNGNSYHANATENAFFFTPQLHAGVSVLGKGHLLLTFYGDFGPMLAGSSNTKGNYGVIGVKIGRRY